VADEGRSAGVHTGLLARAKLWWRLRGKTDEQKENIRCGLPEDFELPYPYPQNEHEEGMNWVSVNRVRSGRAGT
jgi:hypothetical protein